MKKRILHYSFLVPLAIFLIHQFCKLILKVSVPFVDYYVDPFCLSALALHVLAAERYYYFDEPFGYLDIIIATLFLIIVSELVFPYFSAHFTADILDVGAICLGTCWYIATWKYPKHGA